MTKTNEDLQRIYALAPSRAKTFSLKDGLYTESCIGDFSFENIKVFELLEIPERERILNRWADTYDCSGDVVKNEELIWNGPAITENDFDERRKLRMEAGLIEANSPEIPDSSWVPEVGVQCLVYIRRPSGTPGIGNLCIPRYIGRYVVVFDVEGDEKTAKTDEVEFRKAPKKSNAERIKRALKVIKQNPYMPSDMFKFIDKIRIELED